MIRSWVAAANDMNTDAPLINLPCRVFSDDLPARCSMAIGDRILDVAGLEADELLALAPPPGRNCASMSRPLLLQGSPDHGRIAMYLVPMGEATMHMPFLISECTDFHAGKHHAMNVATMVRGAAPELAAPRWIRPGPHSFAITRPAALP